MSQSVGAKSVLVNPNAGITKSKGSDFKKDRKGTGGASDKVKSAKPAPAPREAPKKIFRFIVRKLPFKDFGEEEFMKCLDNVCNAPDNGLVRAAFTLEHFHAGKISRKRGEVYSSGFVAVNDESQYWKFLALCPLKMPFLEGVDESAQPEICVAPNQKAFKLKERTDRHINTFETDPAFLEFTAKLNTPADKLPSAEMQLDLKKSEANKEELMRSNPLLMYMREKAEKKALERRLLRRGGSAKDLTVTSLVSKSSRGGKSRGERAEKVEGKEKSERGKRGEKGSRTERREKKERKDAIETGSERRADGERAARGDREGALEGPGGSAKKPNPRGSRGGGGSGRSSKASEAGGSAQVGDSSGPPPLTVPKFTIAKRNAPLPATGGAPSTLSASGGAPHMTPHLSQGASYSINGQGPPTISMSMSGDARMSVSAGAAVHGAARGGPSCGASGGASGAGEPDKRAPRGNRGGRGARGGESRNENGAHGGHGGDAAGFSGDIRNSQGSGNRGQGGGGGGGGGRGGGRGGRGRGSEGANV